MKIIEKNCPSCGANVKFNENEQKGICEYCKKEFLIEKKYDDDFDYKKMLDLMLVILLLVF